MFGVRKLACVVAVAAIAMLAVTAAAQQAVSFSISSAGGSSVTGSGAITPIGNGDESALNAQWQGLQPGSVHLVTQYHGTSCASYEAAPEFVFTTVTADTQGKAAGLITVKKPFKNWPNRPHFIILHATEDPKSSAIACGMVVAQAATVPAATAAATAPPATPAPPQTGNDGPFGDHAAPAGSEGLLTVSAVVLALGAAGLFASRKRFRRR